ncbi:MAG: HAD family hydrolase [Microthrixaceae bacterium]
MTVSNALRRDAASRSIADPDRGARPGADAATSATRCEEPAVRRGSASGSSATSGLAPSATLRRILAGHGLLGFFDHWSFSDEVGTFKPDPVIFEHALGRTRRRADPSEAAHVGDLRRTDVAGAQRSWACTLGALRGRRSTIPGPADDGTDAVEARVVLGDHAEVDGPALGVR